MNKKRYEQEQRMKWAERHIHNIKYLDGRTFAIHTMFKIPSKKVCLVCRKAGHLQPMCCNRHTYTLGYTLRTPRINAGRSRWKKFETLLFKLEQNKKIRTENLVLDNQEKPEHSSITNDLVVDRQR